MRWLIGVVSRVTTGLGARAFEHEKLFISSIFAFIFKLDECAASNDGAAASVVDENRRSQSRRTRRPLGRSTAVGTRKQII